MSNVSAVIKEMIRQQLLTLHTCLICKVLHVYADGTAKVHPLTLTQTASGNVRQHEALDGVPILDQVKDSVKVGSVCMVIFAERDIAKAITGEYALPSLARHHSLSDGIIIGTIGEENAVPIIGHTHANKSILDSISQTDIDNWNAADSVSVARHLTSGTKIATFTVSGTSYAVYAPSSPTAEQIAEWNAAAENAHAHANKSVLDTITQKNIDEWNSAFAFSNTASMLYYSYSNTDSIPMAEGTEGSIIDCSIASYCATDVIFHAEITLEVETSEIISDDTYTCTDGILTAAYFIGNVEIGAVRPSWTLQDGVHTIHLMHHFTLSGYDAAEFHVRLYAAGCSIKIPARALHAVLEGNYLAGEEAWEGLINAYDNIGVTVQSADVTVNAFSETLSVRPVPVVKQTISDNIAVSLENMEITVDGFTNTVQTEQEETL